jgi:hypothetical protein
VRLRLFFSGSFVALKPTFGADLKVADSYLSIGIRANVQLRRAFCNSLNDSSAAVRQWWRQRGGQQAARSLYRGLALGSIAGELIGIVVHLVIRDSVVHRVPFPQSSNFRPEFQI